MTFTGTSVTDTAGRALISMNSATAPTVVSAGGLTYNLAHQSASLSYTITPEQLLPPGGVQNPQGTICSWTGSVGGTYWQGDYGTPSRKHSDPAQW